MECHFSGVGGYGDVFSVDTNGLNYKELIDFDIVDGEQPFGSLVISGTQLFGMTYEGGANGDGNVFSIDTNGSSFKDILDFNGANGKGPNGSLLIWGDKLYGMTTNGGEGSSPAGCIFSIDTNGITISNGLVSTVMTEASLMALLLWLERLSSE